MNIKGKSVQAAFAAAVSAAACYLFISGKLTAL